MNRQEFFFKNVVRRWQRELASASGRVIIFSPFITSDTAEAVVAATQPTNCELHLAFRAECFASGASSIRTLKYLHNLGCQLYDLPELHAKMVLVCGHFASIGSQNLTRGGSKNREATAAFYEPRQVAHIERLAERWLVARQAITVEMIGDMESTLPEPTRLYRLAAKSAAAVDELVRVRAADRAVERQRFIRTAQEQRELESRHRRSERVKHVRTALNALQRARATIVAEVCRMGSENAVYSLVARNQQKLTAWHIDGQEVRLEKTYRYLCVIRDTGKIGWARVMGTRITFIAQDVIKANSSWIGSHACKFRFSAIWEPELHRGTNLMVELQTPGGEQLLATRCWYGVDRLDVQSVDALASGHEARKLTDLVINDTQAFATHVLRELVQPFLYEVKLRGVEANDFFAPSGSLYELTLNLCAGSTVLVAGEVWVAGRPIRG